MSAELICGICLSTERFIVHNGSLTDSHSCTLLRRQVARMPASGLAARGRRRRGWNSRQNWPREPKSASSRRRTSRNSFYALSSESVGRMLSSAAGWNVGLGCVLYVKQDVDGALLIASRLYASGNSAAVASRRVLMSKRPPKRLKTHKQAEPSRVAAHLRALVEHVQSAGARRCHEDHRHDEVSSKDAKR